VILKYKYTIVHGLHPVCISLIEFTDIHPSHEVVIIPRLCLIIHYMLRYERTIIKSVGSHYTDSKVHRYSIIEQLTICSDVPITKFTLHRKYRASDSQRIVIKI
jgi:hypothetical protein